MDKPSRYILDLERGLPQETPNFLRDVNNSPHSVLRTQETLNLSDYLPQKLKRSQVTYLKGKQDYLLFLNSCGTAIFHMRYGDRFTCTLSKPGESSFKIFSDDETIYLILTRPRDRVLRFYRFEINALRRGTCSRTRVLRNTGFSVDCLKKVDMNSFRVVILTENYLEIWNLSQESKEIFAPRNYYDNLWYSKGHLVKGSTCRNGKILEVINLNDGETKSIVIQGVVNLVHAEVVSHLLVLWDILKPIQVINLRNSDTYFVTNLRPTLYIETELLNDSLITFEDGTARFVSAPHSPIFLTCKDPLHTDNSEILCMVSSNQLYVLSKDGRVLSRSKVTYRNVSSLGINEDTEEIYLGLKNGLVIVLI